MPVPPSSRSCGRSIQPISSCSGLGCIGRKFIENPWMEESLVSRLERFGVDLVLNGHDKIAEHSARDELHYVQVSTGASPGKVGDINPHSVHGRRRPLDRAGQRRRLRADVRHRPAGKRSGEDPPGEPDSEDPPDQQGSGDKTPGVDPARDEPPGGNEAGGEEALDGAPDDTDAPAVDHAGGEAVSEAGCACRSAAGTALLSRPLLRFWGRR